MKLLIAGGSSFIGRNFLREVNFAEDEVTATFRDAAGFPEFVRQLEKPQIRALRHDFLADRADFSQYPVALYLAGNSNHAWSLDHQVEDLTANTIGILRFLETFRGHLVYFSTGAVYYGLKGEMDADRKLEPTFPYAISKLAAEHYIRAAHASGKLAGFTLVRFYYAFGPYEPERRLVGRLLRRFSAGERSIQVAGDGSTLMSPMYAGDLAGALERVVRSAPLNDAVDLPGAETLSLLEIVQRVARFCAIEPQIEHVPTHEEPLEFRSSGDRFHSLYGFRPKPLEWGLEQYQRTLVAPQRV